MEGRNPLTKPMHFNFFKPTTSPTTNIDSLNHDVVTKILSNLEPKEIMHMATVNKLFSTAAHAALSMKLQEDFGQKLLKNSHPAHLYQERYNQLMNEIELAILYLHHTYIDRCFPGSYLYDTWVNCITINNSFNNFLNSARKDKEKLSFVPYAQKKIESDEKVYVTQFHHLLHTPWEIDDLTVRNLLLILCKVNAYHTLQLFFRKHFNYFNQCAALQMEGFTLLLQQAIICLQPDIIKVLLPLANNKRKYLLNAFSQFNHEKKNILCSPLYFSFDLPRNRMTFLNTHLAKINYDHPALLEIIKLLLANGHDPQQRCIDTVKRTEMDRHCIHLINEINPAYLELLDSTGNDHIVRQELRRNSF
ncbi:MAG: hypothetical protein JO149_03475 [Gammaproteobacteria bacterium]|nr:hypothetical protein [Gammaproteobacteria bacterium]